MMALPPPSWAGRCHPDPAPGSELTPGLARGAGGRGDTPGLSRSTAGLLWHGRQSCQRDEPGFGRAGAPPAPSEGPERPSATQMRAVWRVSLSPLCPKRLCSTAGLCAGGLSSPGQVMVASGPGTELPSALCRCLAEFLHAPGVPGKFVRCSLGWICTPRAPGGSQLLWCHSGQCRAVVIERLRESTAQPCGTFGTSLGQRWC